MSVFKTLWGPKEQARETEFIYVVTFSRIDRLRLIGTLLLFSSLFINIFKIKQNVESMMKWQNGRILKNDVVGSIPFCAARVFFLSILVEIRSLHFLLLIGAYYIRFAREIYQFVQKLAIFSFIILWKFFKVRHQKIFEKIILMIFV